MENKSNRLNWKTEYKELREKFDQSRDRLKLAEMKLLVIRAIMDANNPRSLERMLYFCAAVCDCRVVDFYGDNMHLEPVAGSDKGGAA